MNLKASYESLLKARVEVERLKEEFELDIATNARLGNIANRIELTLIDLRVEMEERE